MPGLVASTSDGNRMIDQGAVRIGESAETLTKVAGRDHSLAAGTFLIQVGKHKYRWVALQQRLSGCLERRICRAAVAEAPLTSIWPRKIRLLYQWFRRILTLNVTSR